MSPNNERFRMFTICARCLNRSDHNSASIGQAGSLCKFLLLIPHSEARHFYLSILIGPNNEKRRTDCSVILLQPSINSCLRLRLEELMFLFWQFILGFFCSQDSHCIFYVLKSLKRFGKYMEYMRFQLSFIVAHHTNNLNAFESIKNV